jgi:N-acetylglucosamine-6-phosphate deacetylase
VIAAIGHTDADFDMTEAAAKNGYSLVTHLYSGMRGVVRENAYRKEGCVEGTLYNDSLTAEVIADGKHLPSGLLKLIHKCKGKDRICLITDSTRGAGMPDGEEFMLGKKIGGTRAVIEDGVAKLPDRTSFAGSVCTTDRLFRTMVKLAGVPITEVSKMISATPARVMGYTDRGEIAEGKRADLVIMDKELNIKNIILKGEKQK